tara:strand:- start:41 stop:877 length:837 start_codon:yes stop_codon:yes gene_type:complete
MNEQVQKLLEIKLPEQRSPGWYEMRHNMITASDFGAILGHSKYNSSKQVLKNKCGLGKPFTGNRYTQWGVKYEEIATKLYEHLNQVEVIEFGCIPHPKYSFLGASPDGITKQGTMLEIKVPYCREFKENDIPPHYYDQMQGQLEVCDLIICDFLQCKIEEYDSEQEYFEDNIKYKGSVIEYKDEDFNLKYLYSDFNIDKEKFKKWKCGRMISLGNKNLKIHKITFWKIIKYTIDTVKRQDDWMEKSLPIFKKFWEDVLYYRQNPDELETKKKEIKLNI